MRLLSAASVFAALFSTIYAVDFEKWSKPNHGDLRGPCPALNALANHNIIPHNGRDLSVPLLVEALNASINLSPEIATTVARAALRISSDPLSGTFTLEDIRKHNMIEHDASLSRKDFALGNGNNWQFCPSVFSEFLSYFNGATELTIPAVATARWGRVTSSRKTNPEFVYGPSQLFSSYLESVLYYRLLNNATTGTTPIDFVKILFEQERLPYKEGWRTPQAPIDGFSISRDVLSLALATPEKNFPLFDASDAIRGIHGQMILEE